MAWDGDTRYFWVNEMNNHEGDWDFDALNEGHEIDWGVWDDLAPAAPAVPVEPATNHDIPPPNAPSRHDTSATLEWPHGPSRAYPPAPHLPRQHRDATSSAPPRHLRLPTPQPRPYTQAELRAVQTSLFAPHADASPAQNERSRDFLEGLEGSSSSSEDSSAEDENDAAYLLYPEIFETSPSSSSEEEVEDEDMPPVTRRSRQADTGAVVDLTLESSPPPEDGGNISTAVRQRPAKRSAPTDSTKSARPKKRTKPSNPATPQPIEEFDLTNDTISAEEEVRRAQQQAAIAMQQAAERGDGPLPIGKRQCIICLEPFTDVTITHCGHIYCHECLTQALNAGEKNHERGVGTCPVCRKQVRRNRPNQMIVVSFMKKATFKGKAKRSGSVY